jgi:pimeloyl-ACP methyl ester carboxylesterase
MAVFERDLEIVTSTDGTAIALRRVGSGPPVVVVHGGLGSSRSWLNVAERLGDRFEFLLIDRRGRGDSGRGTEPHSLAHEVADTSAVLAAAGNGAALIGHSYGGAVALEAARAAAPRQIRGLVLYEPAPQPGDLVHVTPRLRELADREEHATALEVSLREMAARGFLRPEEVENALAAGPSPEWDGLVAVSWTMAREIEALVALGAVELYSEIAVPTLLVVGELSLEPHQAHCERLHRVLPASTTARLAGQGHLSHIGDPDQLAAVVGSFLEDPR